VKAGEGKALKRGNRYTSYMSLMGNASDSNRRDFLKTTTVVAAAAASGCLSKPAGGAEPRDAVEKVEHGQFVDTNVTLSRWPGRRLPLDETPALVGKLRSYGVRQAWAGTFDGLLHKDTRSVNARLTEDCRKFGRGLLVPFGVVNPTLPDWEEDLRRCHVDHKMPGIRLHPNYHGYKLDDPVFAKLLDLAGGCGMMVQLVAVMEDERTQHRLMRVPYVDMTPLAGLLKSRPSLRVVLLNWNRGASAAVAAKLTAAGQAYFDIATLEGVGGVANLLKQVPAERVVFGSYAPFFYFESAFLKLRESDLRGEDLTAIRGGNASRLLGLPAKD
jgi:uncharacterized protein